MIRVNPSGRSRPGLKVSKKDSFNNAGEWSNFSWGCGFVPSNKDKRSGNRLKRGITNDQSKPTTKKIEI